MKKTLPTIAVMPILGVSLLAGSSMIPGTARADKMNLAVTSTGVEGNLIGNDRNGAALKAINASKTFLAGNQKIYALYNLKSPSSGYARTVWTTVDVQSMEPNTVIGEVQTQPMDNIHQCQFSLTQTNGWQPGTYKVDLYLHEKNVKTLYFSVT